MSARPVRPASGDECPEAIAARLRSHEYIESARLCGEWALVVPSAQGERRLRSFGKAALIDEWRAWLAGLAPDCGHALDFRLLEALPAPGSAAEARGLQPIRHPIVSDPEAPTGESLCCALRVPFDLAVFDGHFPTFPIVPAVTQIGWVLDLARQYLGIRGRRHGLRSVKFRRPMRPGMRLTLALMRERERVSEQQNLLLRFEYCAAGKPVATGRIVIVASDD